MKKAIPPLGNVVFAILIGISFTHLSLWMVGLNIILLFALVTIERWQLHDLVALKQFVGTAIKRRQPRKTPN